MEILIIIIPAFIALFLVLAIYSHKKEKERRDALRSWALGQDLFFGEEKVRGFGSEHPGFDCLRTGSNRYAYNVSSGELDGFDVRFFDYHYETHSTDSKGRRRTHHHHFSVVMVRSPFRLLPIAIRPEGVFDKIKAAFGWDDINFESAEFSRRYHVKARDKRWAFDMIHGPIMEMLLSVKGLSFECDGRSMICYQGSKRFDLSEFESGFQMVTKILNHVPEHARERVLHHD